MSNDQHPGRRRTREQLAPHRRVLAIIANAARAAAAKCSAADITVAIQILLAATMRKPSLCRIQRPLAYLESYFPRVEPKP